MFPYTIFCPLLEHLKVPIKPLKMDSQGGSQVLLFFLVKMIMFSTGGQLITYISVEFLLQPKIFCYS